MSGGRYYTAALRRIRDPTVAEKRAKAIFLSSLISRGVSPEIAEKVWNAEEADKDHLMQSTSELSGKKYTIDGQPYTVPYRKYEVPPTVQSRQGTMADRARRLANLLNELSRELGPFMESVAKLTPAAEAVATQAVPQAPGIPRPTS